MFNRFIAPITAIAFGLATISPSIAATFSRGSSSPSSSRSFSAPSMPRAMSDSASMPRPAAPPAASNNGFAKPPMQAATPTPPPAASNNGFAKPPMQAATPTPPPIAAPKPPPSALAAAQQKTMSASTLQQYQAQRASAKQPPMPVSTADLRGNAGFTAARARYGSMDDYMAHRQGAYAAYRGSMSSGTIVIVNNMHPNYGMYDSGFLTGMIMVGVAIDLHNAAWLAAQQNQAWYPQYMADLQQQATTNAELQARLTMLQEQMAQAKAQGVSVDASQLPPGADPSVAIAPEAMMADFSQTPNNNGNSHTLLWILVIVAMFGIPGTYIIFKRHN